MAGRQTDRQAGRQASMWKSACTSHHEMLRKKCNRLYIEWSQHVRILLLTRFSCFALVLCLLQWKCIIVIFGNGSNLGQWMTKNKKQMKKETEEKRIYTAWKAMDRSGIESQRERKWRDEGRKKNWMNKQRVSITKFQKMKAETSLNTLVIFCLGKNCSKHSVSAEWSFFRFVWMPKRKCTNGR